MYFNRKQRISDTGMQRMPEERSWVSWPDSVVILRQQQSDQVIYGQLDIRVQQQTWQTQHIRNIISLPSIWPNLNLPWVPQIISPVCCASEVSTEVAVICRLALVSVTAENTMLHRDGRKATNTLSSNVEGRRKQTEVRIWGLCL